MEKEPIMKIPAAVLEALDRAETDGARLVLTGPRMDAGLYAQVDEVLEAAGGIWSSRDAAHVFQQDAATAIKELQRTGHCVTAREKVQLAQFFPTPTRVVSQLVELAAPKPGMEVLEPSAGHGAIAQALVAAGCLVDCIEREPVHAEILDRTGCARTLTVADFLAVEPRPAYDRVVMNPPFTRGADVAHVTHALGFLRSDGHLVAVMSSSVTWNAPSARFRALVAEHGGRVVALPDRAFLESGTAAGAVLVVIPARRPEGEVPLPVWTAPKPSVAPAVDEFLPPAVIARQIEADLKTALRHFAAVTRSLEQPRQDAGPVEQPRLFDATP
jgi:predicted RNA methylase